MENMPSIPVVVAPLLHYFEQPLDQLDVNKVVGLLLQDKSLTAQCLHMANSPLFGHWKKIDSLRGAVVALGFQRLREIVVSCSILKLVPVGQAQINPVVFWNIPWVVLWSVVISLARFTSLIQKRLTWAACCTTSESS